MSPLLPVSSVKETAEFYEKKLGFTTDVIWENPSYAVVRRGNCVIELTQDRSTVQNCCMYLDVDPNIVDEYKLHHPELVEDFDTRHHLTDNNGNTLIIKKEDALALP